MVFKENESACGTNSKGDVIVTLEITSAGGVNIEVTSKVLPKYGESIRKSVGDILAEFKITNANVHVEDFGALDFAIRARTEGAIKRNAFYKEGKR